MHTCIHTIIQACIHIHIRADIHFGEAIMAEQIAYYIHKSRLLTECHYDSIKVERVLHVRKV